MAMANKVGILNGILLVMLNFFAGIPLGISFLLGASSYTEIPLMFASDGLTTIYTWGTSDSGWWLNLGVAGISGLILEFILVLGCILSFIGSWINGDKGRKVLGATLIMEMICFIFIIIDILVIGSLGITIAFAQLFTSIGIGMYMLLIIIVLQFIAIKFHNTEL